MPLENVSQNIDVKASTQSNNLGFVDKIIQKISQGSSTDSLSKAWNMVLEKIDLEIKYNLEKNNILLDTQELIINSLKNTLPTHLQEYNVASFDTDNNWIIDQTEEQNYLQELAKMLNHILKLQSAQKFQDIHEEVDWYWQTQINGYERTEKILNEYWIDEYLRPDITEHELSEMKERSFDFSSTDSWKEIWILIWNESGESVKDVLKMFASIGSTLWLIWIKYFSKFWDLLEQRSSKDPNIAQEAAIKVEELMRTNPILWLVELFWEQWIEMIKNLWEMIQSWKQWDIATKITMIFWLLSGAGTAKVVSKLKSSKKAPTSAVEVNSPYEGVIPDNIEEMALKTTKEVTEEAVTQWVNTWNQAITQSVWETQFSSEKKISHQEIEARKVAAEKKSWYSPLQVIENTSWDTKNPDLPNQLLKEAWLEELTPEKLKILEFVHTSISKWVWRNDEKWIELITKTLANAWIGKAERNLIIRSWLAGKFEYDISWYKVLEWDMNSKPFHWDVINFLESKWHELSFDELVLGFTYRWSDSLEEFNDWLDWLGKKWVSKQIFSELEIASNKVLARKILEKKKPEVKYEELKLFSDSEDINQLFSVLSDWSLLKILENDAKNLNWLSQSNINLSLLSPDNLERLLSISKTTYEWNLWLGKMQRNIDSNTYVTLSNKQKYLLEDSFWKTLSTHSMYNDVIFKLNNWKLDLSTISSDRLPWLKHMFNKNFIQASNESRLQILEKSDPRSFTQETLDRFFYFWIDEIQDIETLKKIRSYVVPGGKFEGVLQSYGFNVDKILEWINNNISQLS